MSLQSYEAFRCLAADCDDTCCSGWMVNVDKGTYHAYQNCEDPELGPRLRELVPLNPASISDADVARITFAAATCPFLTEGLCGIQKKLGESYLSKVCAAFPRVIREVDSFVERSLDLACPEAARLVLLDPAPLEFERQRPGAPDPNFYHTVRAFLIELLQHRAYPLSKRLVIVGAFCDQLDSLAAGQQARIPLLIASFHDAVRRNLFNQSLDGQTPRPALQLEILLEIIVARITAEYTAPRFFDCYRQFKEGVAWTAESSMADIGRNYAALFAGPFAAFLSQHGHMLEHYLVNTLYRKQVPFKPGSTVREQCLNLFAVYGIVQAILIGMAGHFGELTPGHAVRAIQAITKGFEHSSTLQERVVKLLAEKRVTSCAALALLIRN